MPTARSTRCGLVSRELEGHPGHVRADQQAQRPAQQAPEPGRVDGAVPDGLAVRGERHEKGLQRRGVGGRSGAEGLRDGQLRRSTVRVVDHEQRHAEQAEAPYATAPTPTARSGHLLSVAGHPSHDEQFTVHVAQHLLLTAAAPLLLALSAPTTLALRTLRLQQRQTLLAVVHSRTAAVLLHPVVVLVLSTGALYASYLTPLFAAAEQHPLAVSTPSGPTVTGLDLAPLARRRRSCAKE